MEAWMLFLWNSIDKVFNQEPVKAIKKYLGFIMYSWLLSNFIIGFLAFIGLCNFVFYLSLLSIFARFTRIIRTCRIFVLLTYSFGGSMI